jgi:hypothetical protein
LENDKIEAYLGFCLRSKKITLGVDGMEKLKKGVYLLMADKSLSENSLKKLTKFQAQFACPLIIAQGRSLGELLHRPSVKAAAIQDKNLAAAIVSAAEGNIQYNSYSGGNI